LEYRRVGESIEAERDWNRTVKDKLRLWFMLLALVAAGVLISVVYRFSDEWLVVDRCLSANHGSFDYSSMKCDVETNHPYVPYQLRHPRDKHTALVAFAFFAVFLTGYSYSRIADKKK
jgi:hypothetical protein